MKKYFDSFSSKFSEYCYEKKGRVYSENYKKVTTLHDPILFLERRKLTWNMNSNAFRNAQKAQSVSVIKSQAM